MTSLKKISTCWLLPAFAYLGMTLAITYPLMLHLGDYFIGGEEDGSLSVWSVWWMKFALAEQGIGIFDCQYLLYPFGANLTFHAMPKVIGAAGIPLQGFLSLATAYDLIAIMTFVASGLAAYWLSLRLVHRPLPAFITGAFFAFSPYRLGHFSHIHMLSTMLIPVFIVLIMKGKEALDAGSPRQWLYFSLAGVSLGLTAYDTEHYAIFLAIFSLVFAAFYFPWRDRGLYRQWLPLVRGLALAMVLGVAVFSPMLYTAARFVAVSDDIVVAGSQQVRDLSADLLSFFIPGRGGGLFAGAFGFINEDFLSSETSFLGWMAIILAVAGAWHFRRVREVRLWVLTGAVFTILALGPVMIVRGADTRVPLPYTLINSLPLLDMIRAPSRYVVMTSLALAVLSGYGACALFDGLKKHRRAPVMVPAAAVALLLLFVVELYPRVNLVSLEAPPVYAEIAASSIPGSVVSLPLGWESGNTGKLGREAAYVELYQTVHKRPLVGGVLSRGSGRLVTEIAAQPVLSYLADPEGQPSADDRDPEAIARIMRQHQIAFIVIHKYAPRQIYDGEVYHLGTPFTPEELAALDRYITGDLGMTRMQETAEVTAYRRSG